MKWPFSQNENRAESSLTDTLVQVITSRAGGQQTAFPTATGALEASAGLVSRAFAMVIVEDASDLYADALTPSLMAMMGRALIRSGEILLYIDVRDGRLDLVPVASHNVNGGYNHWTYELNLAGPDSQTTLKGVPADSVVHVRYASDPDTPWRGIGPLASASLAGKLSAETVAALADEASGPRGHLLPVPRVDGDDDTMTAFKGEIKALKGTIGIVESQADDWASGERKRTDWDTRRLGASPPESLVDLAKHSSFEVYAACGLSPALFDNSDGTGQREAWRRALFGVVAPLGKIAESELRLKLEAPDLRLTWDELRASDLQGRARALQSMTGAGATLKSAAEVAGLSTLDVEPPKPTPEPELEPNVTRA